MKVAGCSPEFLPFKTSNRKQEKQEMPSPQQKSAKNCPEMYLLIGLNPILVILRFDDGHSPDYKTVNRWFFKEP